GRQKHDLAVFAQTFRFLYCCLTATEFDIPLRARIWCRGDISLSISIAPHLKSFIAKVTRLTGAADGSVWGAAPDLGTVGR
ncbi:hypothetical protein KZ291_32695, partial [Escherichia coli]|nr:hypothetical protein [Escherichia coli]